MASGPSVSVKPSLRSIYDGMKRRGNKLADLNVAHKKCSILLDQWVLLNFSTQGGNVGGWEPFAHGGRVKGSYVDTSAKLLQDTGRLRRSFTPWYSKSDAGIGSELPYAKYHEEGSARLPQRRMLPRARVDTALMDKFRAVFDGHVKTSIK